MKAIHVLRKPCSEPTVAANAVKHGTGGLNIDASRIAWANAEDAEGARTGFAKSTREGRITQSNSIGRESRTGNEHPKTPASGRWPANLVLGACVDLDEVFPHTKSPAVCNHRPQSERTGRSFRVVQKEAMTTIGPGDEGSAARYFKRVG